MGDIDIFTAEHLMERGWMISVSPDTQGAFTASAAKTFPGGMENEYYFTFTSMPDEQQAWQAICSWASAIEYGGLYRKWRPTEMYFDRRELLQWISQQQLEQFEKMYPECVEISYQSALGMLYSQIGELFDIQKILNGETTDGTVKILRWMLTVLTAYNITSPSNKHSQTLEDNFQMVMKKVTELKTGTTTLSSAPIKTGSNAWPSVITSKNKMLG